MVDSTNLPEIDINQIATDLNNKMDRDGVNASCPTLLSRTSSSYNGVVEIWSDGYCVQTGFISSETWITFDVSFINTNYLITASQNTAGSGDANYYNTYYFRDKALDGVRFVPGQQELPVIGFRIEGYIR